MFENFWLICGIWCGFLGATYMRSDLRRAVARGEMTAKESRIYVLGIAAWIFIPCFFLWLLQRSAGSSYSADFKNWPHPQRTIAVSLTVILWGALLYWAFLSNGARKLAAISRDKHWSGVELGLTGTRVLAVIVVVMGATSLLWAGA